MLRSGLFITLLFALLASGFAVQGGNTEDIFTISVAAPTLAKDVQVRYFFTGEFGGHWSSVADQIAGNKIVIKTGVEGKSAKTFKAIVYAPGCQLATISVDGLSTSSRQSQFQCQDLTAVDLRGRIALSKFGERELEIKALYVCGWAGRFFEVPGAALSPIPIAQAHVETDGSFAMQLPDFAADPLWPSLSHDAALMFFLVDARSGEHLASLGTPKNLSRQGLLKIASSYPEVEFVIQPQADVKAVKSSQ